MGRRGVTGYKGHSVLNWKRPNHAPDNLPPLFFFNLGMLRTNRKGWLATVGEFVRQTPFEVVQWAAARVKEVLLCQLHSADGTLDRPNPTWPQRSQGCKQGCSANLVWGDRGQKNKKA